MKKFKAFAFGALIFTSLTFVQSASEENFEDADKDSDYSSSSFNRNNEKWDLRHTIPGEPDIDYPIYAYPIKTSFSCDNRLQGYYADVEARCQVFRICTNTALSGEGFAFLCPNGTLFSQKNFVCDWYRNVDCSKSENFYFKNEEIGKSMNHDNLMESVKEIVEYPMRTISKALGLGGSTALSQLKSKNDTSISSVTSSTPSNDTNGEKLTKSQISDRNKSAGIDIRSDIKQTSNFNDNNQRTPTKYTQQTPINGRQRNDSRGQTKHGRTNQNLNSRSKANTFGSVTPTNDKEQIDVQKYTLPDKVYVNTLGELSTDVGSNFDIKTSYILKPDADSTAIRGTKKSLDDVLGDSEAYKNHLKNQQREKLREGLLGSVNHKIVSTTIRTTPKTEQDQDNLQVQSDTKLSFAESVNAGLTNLENSNPVIPKKVEKSNENYLNLADNINIGLFDSNKKVQKIEIPETIKKQENYHRTANIETRLSTATKTGQSFHGYEPVRTKTTTQDPNSFRNGRQFKFLGSGFTRTGETEAITVEPYVSNLKNNGYLPPLLSRTGLKSNGVTNKDSLIIQLNNEENLKNLLLDINNINNDEVSASNIAEIHVKKRAEELLLQGVHQTLYENDETTTNYDLYNKTIIDDNSLQETTDKMIIRVYSDSEEDINNDNVLNLNQNLNQNLNENNKNNITEQPIIKSIFKLTTELNAGPIIVTDPNINTEKTDLNIVTEPITDSEIITSITPKTVTESSVNSTLEVKINSVEKTQQIDNKNYIKFRKLNYNLTDRRQTAKPIVYSKKPYTLRNYPKTSSSTTVKPYKYLENRRNSYRNRLIGNNNNNNNNNDIATVTETNLVRKTNEQDLNDLTAVANTYGVSNKLQNNTRYSLLRRTKPTFSSRTKKIVSSTTTLPTISNLNLTSISNFVPFGNNIAINKENDNNIQFNLQNSNSNNYNNNNNNNINNNIQHQQIEPKNQKFYYSIGTQQGNQKSEISKPIGSYTEIPGTNIKISKSNEETSFILSSDPRHQPQLIKSPPTINREKNGYIPLNEYITNTLNDEIRNLATQTPPTNYNYLNNQQNSQQLLNNFIPQFTTISPIQQQQHIINFGLTQQNGQNNYHPSLTNIPHPNYGYQISGTTVKPYGNELISDHYKNSFASLGGPLIQPQLQPQQPTLTQSYYNSFSNLDLLSTSTTQKPSTNVNIYNNLSDGSVLLPDIAISTNDNFTPNLQSNYQNFVFNPLPIAQRRLDVVKDDEKESEIYNKGITSYNVPIGSIGRLGRQLALRHRKI